MNAVRNSVTLALVIGATLICGPISSQDVPPAPEPAAVQTQMNYAVFLKPQPVFRTSDYVGIAALAGLHMGDVITTYQGQNSICHCVHEGNPLSPAASNLAGLIAYHAAWVGANAFVTYKLEKHHHRVIAWEIRIAQAGVEAYVVGHNIRVNDWASKQPTK